MGKQEHEGQHSALLRSVSPAGIVVAALFSLGVVVNMTLEGMSLIDSLYATTGIITTVGILVIPKTMLGRAFTGVFNVASLGAGMLLVSEIGDSRKAWARGVLKGGARASSAAAEAAYLGVATAVPLCVATAAFCALEGWSLFESAYFCLTCASGLGMGDVEPKSPTSRLLFTVYIWSVMGVAINLCGLIGSLAVAALSKHLGHK